MPIVHLSLIQGRKQEEKKALLDLVHQALVEAFGIPEHDRTQRITEYPPEDFEFPPGKSAAYLVVEISAFAGRSPEAKGRLYQKIAQGLTSLGQDPQDLMILLNEQPPVNWGLRGGQRGDQIALGFEVKV
ncbi:MAG: hypothetical protein A2600_00190 [Candidatus Lambdaproteobacteria bacterium RIFOXYD1_FULL_56_27]|uniref:4-oxalocrotonate tautomerase n=1 Tax=Candidatus Lambdaproteobacteria bacterium RIFOXYD2_FULL_56_26 TaxID=1817773 RepID=A0A1F6GPK8_9PROT|nr:MAG: hypothetical protein A2557_04310 [Candidatus Lambdaproteobacteria bacterium RIFOXYD2_FULL_56_26]OGH03936.1 MAG: hypothetical protein A2426_07535 [Candidatus Lambdaproteobacteria bacterium RIFOXYC1_FULL_56_13]OGH06193.1 MAG: hypothetical protein A2600_00190 [Candidatus Lambdaproteobacteria bacterium RIFOXYD1_FULL_56_27]